MPTAGTNSARFSPDGKYLFVPQDSKLVGSLRECLTIYSISSGGVFTKVSSDASFLAGPAYGVAFLDPVLGSG
jgi:hypothetical protein